MRVIATQTRDHEVYYLNERSSQVAKTKTSVVQFDSGSLAFNYSIQKTGLNKHSLKQWYRWENGSSCSVKRNKEGRLVPTNRTSTGVWYGGRTAMEIWLAHVGIARADMPLSIEDRGLLAEIVNEVNNFPLRAMCGNVHTIPAGGFMLVQEPDPAALTRRLFGITRYRKDLVKAVANAHLTTAMVASTFRGLAPTDWIIDFIKNSTVRQDQNFVTSFNVTKIRPVLLKSDKRSYRRLLNEEFDRHALQSVEDVVRGLMQARAYPADQRITDWTDFHDKMWDRRNFARGGIIRAENMMVRPIGGNIIRSYTPPAPVEIKPSLAAQKVHDAFAGTRFTHIMPTGSEMLNEWSDEMNNCIRGYDRQAANQSIILGALELDGKMVVNYELADDMTVKQLLGRRNQPLDRALHDEVVSIMEKAGVMLPAYYTGKPYEAGAGIRIAYEPVPEMPLMRARPAVDINEADW